MPGLGYTGLGGALADAATHGPQLSFSKTRVLQTSPLPIAFGTNSVKLESSKDEIEL